MFRKGKIFMSKSKEEKRKLRALQKSEKKRFESARKRAEKDRLEDKRQENYPQIDPALLKAIDDYQKEEEQKKKGFFLWWSNQKKATKVVCSSLALALAASCSSVLGYVVIKSNDPFERDPKETDHIESFEPTIEPTETPDYETPTVSIAPTSNPTVAPTFGPSSEPTSTVEVTQRPVNPRPTVRPTEAPTEVPTDPVVDPTANPTQHNHNFLDWFSFDDSKEARECSECDAVEYRSHSYTNNVTYSSSATKGSHWAKYESECGTCGHKTSKKSYENCTPGKMTYDKNFEYIECVHCEDILSKTSHDLITEIDGNWKITTCKHAGCGYKSKVFVGSMETPSPTVRPTQKPTNPPSPEPTRDQSNTDDNGGHGIGNGDVKPFESEAVSAEPTLPPDIEINTPQPEQTMPPDIEVNTPEPVQTLPPDIEVNRPDSASNSDLGTGNKKDFDSVGAVANKLASLKKLRGDLATYLSYQRELTVVTSNDDKRLNFHL